MNGCVKRVCPLQEKWSIGNEKSARYEEKKIRQIATRKKSVKLLGVWRKSKWNEEGRSCREILARELPVCHSVFSRQRNNGERFPDFLSIKSEFTGYFYWDWHFKVHIFYEGHKNLTKYPSFLGLSVFSWQRNNGERFPAFLSIKSEFTGYFYWDRQIKVHVF